jgi:hypothetical protein
MKMRARKRCRAMYQARALHCLTVELEVQRQRARRSIYRAAARLATALAAVRPSSSRSRSADDQRS